MRTGSSRILCLLFLPVLVVGAGRAAEAGGTAPAPTRPESLSREGARASASAADTPLAVEEPEGDLHLEQALALALLKNPSLLAAAWEARATEAMVLQTARPPNPELEVEVENFGGRDLTRGFAGSEITVQLSQRIELAGKRLKRKRVAASERDLAGWDYEIERVRVLSETAHAFVDVLVAQERTALYEEFAALAEQVLAAAAERVRFGKAAPVEETRARVYLASCIVNRERARHGLTAARSVLAAVWGDQAAHFRQARGDLTRLPALPDGALLSGPSPELPEIARGSGEVNVRQANLALEQARRIPDLTLSAGVRRLPEIEETAFVMGLSIPLPILDRNQGAVQAARHRRARADAERAAIEAGLRESLTRAVERLASALRETAALRDHLLPGARSAFETCDEGYRYGKFDYLDVLDAQRTFLETRARYIDTLAEVHKSRVDVARLTGEPMDSIPLLHEGDVP